MRRMLAIAALICAACTAAGADPNAFAAGKASFAFRHPGVLVSKEGLDYIKSHLGEEPWKSKYEGLANNKLSYFHPPIKGARERIARFPGKPEHNHDWRHDMNVAWHQALMWYFTGDERHAVIARKILVDWATKHKHFDGWEACLDLGDCLPQGVSAADILRGTWKGWSGKDTALFQKLLKEVYLPCTYLVRGEVGPGNKGNLSMVAAFSIAVFCDDADLFKFLLKLYVTDGVAGLESILSTGETPEAGRDQGHDWNGLWSLARCAEIAWNQGLDLYSARDNRLWAAGEYYAQHSLMNDLPFITHGTTDWLYKKPCNGGWENGLAAFNLLKTVYGSRRGMKTPWLDLKREHSTGDATAFLFWRPGEKTKARTLKLAPPTAIVAADGGWKEMKGRRWAYAAKIDSGDGWVKVRDSVGDDAKCRASMSVKSKGGENKAEWSFRGWNALRGGTRWQDGSRDFPDAYPVWVRIVREDRQIYAQWSPDGASWSSLGIGCYYDLPDNLFVAASVGRDAPIASPSAPLQLFATSDGGEAQLRWSGSAGAKKYAIYRRAKGEKFKRVGETESTNFFDKPPAKPESFVYCVCGENTAGRSKPSPAVRPVVPALECEKIK